MHPLVVVLIGYLLGSIPFGYVIVRLTGGGDVRATGSGGTGATNVTRRAGKWAGILTLALDAVKGIVAVLLARWLLPTDASGNWWLTGAALAALLGHIFPIWLGFRGGKGVATGLGIFLALSPLAVVFVAVLFLVVVWRTRYVSLGSMVAAASLPLAIWLLSRYGVSPGRHVDEAVNPAPLVALAMMGGALIIFMHRANIGRLLSGTENKLKM